MTKIRDGEAKKRGKTDYTAVLTPIEKPKKWVPILQGELAVPAAPIPVVPVVKMTAPKKPRTPKAPK